MRTFAFSNETFSEPLFIDHLKAELVVPLVREMANAQYLSPDISSGAKCVCGIPFGHHSSCYQE